MSQPPHRELPAHIARALGTDSAGIAWQGRDLSGPGNPLHTFDGDDGLVPQALQVAAEQLTSGEMDEAGFVRALAGQRLFAPVIATGHGDAEQGDKEAEISLVTLTASDGRGAMPAFSCVEALTAWNRQARPVAAQAERIMLAALTEEAQLVVLDPPGELSSPAELTFVVRRPAVEALAQGASWLPSYQDVEIARALEDIVATSPGVEQLRVSPGRGISTVDRQGRTIVGGGTGPELSIGVVVAQGLDPVDQRLALATVKAHVRELQIVQKRADSVEILHVVGDA